MNKILKNECYLDSFQLAERILYGLILTNQSAFQLPGLFLQLGQMFYYFGPLRLSQHFQQVMPDTGEDSHVDIQSGVHQLHVFFSLWDMEEETVVGN